MEWWTRILRSLPKKQACTCLPTSSHGSSPIAGGSILNAEDGTGKWREIHLRHSRISATGGWGWPGGLRKTFPRNSRPAQSVGQPSSVGWVKQQGKMISQSTESQGWDWDPRELPSGPKTQHLGEMREISHSLESRASVNLLNFAGGQSSSPAGRKDQILPSKC